MRWWLYPLVVALSSIIDLCSTFDVSMSLRDWESQRKKETGTQNVYYLLKLWKVWNYRHKILRNNGGIIAKSLFDFTLKDLDKSLFIFRFWIEDKMKVLLIRFSIVKQKYKKWRDLNLAFLHLFWFINSSVLIVKREKSRIIILKALNISYS